MAGQQGVLNPVEAAEVVETGEVVDVMVRVEHSIDSSHVIGDALKAKLGRGVDEQARGTGLNQNARPRRCIICVASLRAMESSKASRSGRVMDL